MKYYTPPLPGIVSPQAFVRWLEDVVFEMGRVFPNSKLVSASVISATSSAMLIAR